MDLKWFLKYLTLSRWSKLIAVSLACVFFAIVAFYFIFLQSNYKQSEWHFKNAGFISHSLTLQPNRVYRISWEDDYKSFPSEVEINGLESHTYNYLTRLHKNIKHDYCCNVDFINPMYIRVHDLTDFELSFLVETPLNWGKPGSFFSTWLESFSDPIGIVNWSVVDVTDSANHNFALSVDGTFPVYKFRK